MFHLSFQSNDPVVLVAEALGEVPADLAGTDDHHMHAGQLASWGIGGPASRGASRGHGPVTPAVRRGHDSPAPEGSATAPRAAGTGAQTGRDTDSSSAAGAARKAAAAGLSGNPSQAARARST